MHCGHGWVSLCAPGGAVALRGQKRVSDPPGTGVNTNCEFPECGC